MALRAAMIAPRAWKPNAMRRLKVIGVALLFALLAVVVFAVTRFGIQYSRWRASDREFGGGTIAAVYVSVSMLELLAAAGGGFVIGVWWMGMRRK